MVVKISGAAELCAADEVGEICVAAKSTAGGYWALEGQTAHAFRTSPLGPDRRPLGPAHYVRSGLVGFMGPQGLVFVCGAKTGLMHIGGRWHSSDDVIATALAVEPMKFIYRGRIAVFSVDVLRDQRMCIVAEQKPNVSEEEVWITCVKL